MPGNTQCGAAIGHAVKFLHTDCIVIRALINIGTCVYLYCIYIVFVLYLYCIYIVFIFIYLY